MDKIKIKKIKEIYSSKLNTTNTLSKKKFKTQPFFTKIMTKLEIGDYKKTV